MNAGRGRCGAQRRKESLPPPQIQEDFTEEAALKSVLKGLGGVRQVGVGERAFQAKDSRAKSSEAGCGLENGRGSGEGRGGGRALFRGAGGLGGAAQVGDMGRGQVTKGPRWLG